MFSLSKSSRDASDAADTSDAQAEADAIEQGPAKKSRPTPTRKEAEAANKRPLVPNDRRAAAKAARIKQRAQRDAEFAAMKAGDERALPYRDRGPVKKYARNYVDARHNVGEYFLFVAMFFLVLAIIFGKNPYVSLFTLALVYSVVFVALIDTFVAWKRLKKRLIAKFGDDVELRGVGRYTAMRVFQIRRARLPKPMVKHGEYPA